MTVFGAQLADPAFLLLGLLAAVAVWFSLSGSGRVVFSSLRALPASGSTWRTRLAWIPDALFGLAIVALAIALSGPRKGDDASRVRREGIAIAMSVDVSGSMRAQDLAESVASNCRWKPENDPTRLGVVKRVFEKFVRSRPDDAIGLVAFATYAETRSPLTLDHTNLITAARELDFAPEEESGTKIGNGLELAITRLAEFKPNERGVGRVAILLTDGETTIRDDKTIDEDTAIDDAIKAGVKVYTIGAGTSGIAPVCTGPGGDLVRTRVSIDETTLRRIADKTGGQYFRATDHASLEQVYEQIDKLERTQIEDVQFTRYRQFYSYFVFAAMALVVAALLLRGTLLRRLP
ncbi:MAG: VWA domain-containing protein [Kofleriaceae bacterium]|nr:VWA domain-containing protein [Kofleriaceae bacterium]